MRSRCLSQSRRRNQIFQKVICWLKETNKFQLSDEICRNRSTARMVERQAPSVTSTISSCQAFCVPYADPSGSYTICNLRTRCDWRGGDGKYATPFTVFLFTTVSQGSGKTLAYGLPILHSILSEKMNARKQKTTSRRTLCALVLAPTRELALQVSSHLSACMNPPPDEGGKVDGPSQVSKSPPLVSIAAIVGGMSAQKQRRILDRGLDILVATPGRLWDIIQEVSST